MTTTTPDKAQIERPEWLTEDVWPFMTRTRWLGDTPVAYTDEGSGPTLLLVHDGMWSYVWGQLIERLLDDFRLVTLDFPGAGISPANDMPVSLESDSSLLSRFVDELNLGSFTLVAHDLGGPVGLGMARHRPDQIDGLVLINTFAWPPHTKGLQRMMRVISSGTMTRLNVATGIIPRATSSGLGIGKHLSRAEKWAFVRSYAEPEDRRRFHTLMGSVLEETEYLEEVEQAMWDVLGSKAALSIYGERNDPFGFQEKFRGYLDHVEEMVIPKGNHFPMSDDPNGVGEAIHDWHRRVTRT